MKKVCITVCICCLLLTACGGQNVSHTGGADAPETIKTEAGNVYTQITQDEAKKIMDSGENYILLDVREQDEYDAGHIPGARLLPYTEVAAQAADMLPDKTACILVYCRSGRRSKIAATALANLGYTDVREFGGILDWQYETEK